MGDEVLSGIGDGGGEWGVPCEYVLVEGGVIIVVCVGRKKVVGGWKGAASKEEGLGVAVQSAVGVFELL